MTDTAASLYVINISTKVRGQRQPLTQRYAIAAESKEKARERFYAQMSDRISDGDTVWVETFEDGICRVA